MNCSRRRFLELVVGSGAVVEAGGLAGIEALIRKRGEWRDHVEESVPSICQLCPGGCGLMVRTVGGIPVKLDGNRFHPVNRGALCPRGQAGLQLLYHPDRIKTPLRRRGEKGSDNWEPVSWDDGLGLVAEALGKLRDQGKPEAVAILGGEYRGLIDRLWTRFARACGTPNYIRLRALRPELPDPVAVFMHGAARPITFDLRETALVLSFGCNWLEGWNAPVYQMQAYGHIRQGRGGGRAELIHVEPRLSYTAAKSDRWIPVRPGTEGVFALGLAHLILREELYDSDFIRDHALGFENRPDAEGRMQAGFRQLVLSDYAPVRVGEITGVSPETIVTVARRFAQLRPSIALYDDRSALNGSDLYTWMAIHSLNALVGSIGVRGGILPGEEPPPLAAWPDLVPDATAERGLDRARLDQTGLSEGIPGFDRPGQLADAVVGSESSPVELLILHRANPLHGRPDKERLREALARIPLVVSLSNFPDETSAYADLILPEHHSLESWLDDEINFLPGFSAFGVGRPAITPLYDTRHAGDIALSLSRAMGGSAAAFPWESYEDLLRFSARGLFAAGRGYVVSTENDEILREVFHMQGYRIPEFESFDDFWEALTERGAWWERAEESERARLEFGTPSGKFEFHPQILESSYREAARAGILGAQPRDGQTFVPRVLLTRRSEPDESFPFILRTYQLLSIGPDIGANLPWLQETPAAHVEASWGSVVEIHPETAQEVGVRDGDRVWVESASGRLRVRARLFPGTRKEVVSLAVGQGHTAGGRWARDRGADAGDLFPHRADVGEGFGTREIVRVRVYRA